MDEAAASQKVFLTRRYLISCMHTLSSPHLSSEENARLYGKCCNQHGHDYRVEVTVQGTIDPMTGLGVDRDRMDDVIQGVLVRKFDGTDLNAFFPSTSGENLAKSFFEILERALLPLQTARVRLQETPKNFFTWGKADMFPDGNLLG